jgi:hypothetical protein
MALLPEPRLKFLDDQTGLTVFQYDKMAPGLLFCDVVVVKASFALTVHGIDPRPTPGQLSLADTHRVADSPMNTSLAQAGDLILGKPGADIYVTGHARNHRPSKWWRVGVRVDANAGPQDKPLAHYECAATGPRVWQYTMLKGWHLSDPETTQAVPVQYELSYGGRTPNRKKPDAKWDSFKPNPCGSGYSFDGYSTSDTYAGPQWERAGLLGSWKSNELVGLGPVARFWATRSRYAGTYDAVWKSQHKPGKISDYAPDFDMRFFQCAHPALQTQKPLRGDEALQLEGLLPINDPANPLDNRMHTKLPGLSVVAAWDSTTKNLPLDTVHIDLNAGQVHLVWRATLEQSLGIEQLHLRLDKI